MVALVGLQLILRFTSLPERDQWWWWEWGATVLEVCNPICERSVVVVGLGAQLFLRCAVLHVRGQWWGGSGGATVLEVYSTCERSVVGVGWDTTVLEVCRRTCERSVVG